jgi:hypothetical protein
MPATKIQDPESLKSRQAKNDCVQKAMRPFLACQLSQT